jgi:hypothetical protein
MQITYETTAAMIDLHRVKLEQVARFIDNHDSDMRVIRITDTHVVCETRATDVDGNEVIETDYVSTIRGAKRLLGY